MHVLSQNILFVFLDFVKGYNQMINLDFLF